MGDVLLHKAGHPFYAVVLKNTGGRMPKGCNDTAGYPPMKNGGFSLVSPRQGHFLSISNSFPRVMHILGKNNCQRSKELYV